MRIQASHTQLWLCTSLILANVSKTTWAQVFWTVLAIFWCGMSLLEEWKSRK